MSVTTCLYRCLHTNYFAERSYCCHIPPLGILILGLSSVVSMTPSMATDLIAVNGNRSYSSTAPLSPLLASGGPPVKNWPGSIIRRCRVDSSRRKEHLRYLASTSLWPSAVRFSSTLQPLGNRGISLINSSIWTQIFLVEGNYESAAVFIGQ